MTNTNQPYNPKSIIKTISIIHYAYCIAILIFGTVALFITENATINLNDTSDFFFFLVPVFAIGGATASNFIFQNGLKGVRDKSTLKEKLTQYQSLRIIRIALVEAPALLGIVVFIITTNQFYVIIAAVLLAYLILLRPSLSIIKEDLDLNAEQESELREAFKQKRQR